MTMAAHWRLDDIAWDRFDPEQVDTDTLRVVKAAAIVESNGAVYADYLCSVFGDDPEFQNAARQWGTEEQQHGRALARWAKMADEHYDFDACFARFAETITLPVSATDSVRGSRCSELIARCVVEVGTSSYYAALAESVSEPVLKEICRRIEADELRHYKMFYRHMKRYLEKEKLGRWQRVKVAVGRLREQSDDELAFAYYAGNGARGAYVRKACMRAYARRAYGLYRRHHVQRGVAMVLKAVGLKPNGSLSALVTRFACRVLHFRLRRLAAESA